MIGVVSFPGTNCDQDVLSWLQHKNYSAKILWHLDQFNIHDFSGIVLPGGFSYGDYLRSGALAAKSPVIKSIKEFADFGKPVLGICNGFQILCEAGLLPGVLVKNEHNRFIDAWVDLTLESSETWWSRNLQTKANLKIPIAHGDGRYFISDVGLKSLQDQNQIWLKYAKNPNGSVADIAGVLNQQKNVAGLMPHPERALFDWMGCADGWGFL